MTKRILGWTGVALLALLLGLAAVPAPSTAEAEGKTDEVCAGISGLYVGTYTATSSGTSPIAIVFTQSGDLVNGNFLTPSGMNGVGGGRIASNVADMNWVVTTAWCPGDYLGKYTFSGDTVTWTYSGNDCTGHEAGQGQATKQE